MILKKGNRGFQNFSPWKPLEFIQNFGNEHTQQEGMSGREHTTRGHHTATGLRTKPSAEQIQPGAYDLDRPCHLSITGKQLASSGSVFVCVPRCVWLRARSLAHAHAYVRTCVSVSRFLYVSLSVYILSVHVYLYICTSLSLSVSVFLPSPI